MAKEKTLNITPPRENPKLIGHAAAQAQFLREAERGLLHHAYLMTGPKGIGKATLAYHFARYILSRGAVTKKEAEAPSFSLFGDAPEPIASAPQPSNDSLHMPADSALFRRVAGGSHTDLLVLQPQYDEKKGIEKNIISIEEARKVPEFLSLTPAESEWRVVIVDAVDQLNVNAANALLKILEEPPARAILLLVCHQPGSILPTIRSRCRQFALQAPSAFEFEEILGAVAPSIMLHEYAGLRALSAGSAGFAITLNHTDGVAWYKAWLEAMQPTASAQARQQFADRAAAQKSPDVWRTIMHGFDTALTRINSWPYVAKSEFVFEGEGALLATIAEHYSPKSREIWRARAAELLTVTDVFNLEKRQSVSMLLNPDLLESAAT